MPAKGSGFMAVLTKEYLEEEFVRKKRKQRDIAREHGCSEGHLSHLLNLYGLRQPKSHRFVGDQKKYGALEPLEVVGKDEHGHSLVLALCDCGNRTVELLYQLTTGCKSSCGCQSRKRGVDNPYFRGVGEIPYRLWKSWQKGASDRGYAFDITMEYAWGLFLEQERRCSLTGVELVFAARMVNQRETTASLDRIDSNEGYREGNVRWCHKFINVWRTNYSDEQIIYWAGKLWEHHQRTVGAPLPTAERVFVAGPVWEGDPVENLRAADEATLRLIRAGYAAYAPQRAVLVGTAVRVNGVASATARPVVPDTTPRQWWANEEAWLATCGYVLRLPGISAETDRWLEMASARRIRVFGSLDELLTHRSPDRKSRGRTSEPDGNERGI